MIPEWGASVHSRLLWVSPTNSPVRLGVSPTAASSPMGVFTQRFEALFPCAGALGCVICFTPPLFLLVYLYSNVGPQGLPATSWPVPFHNPPPRWVHQPLPCRQSSLPGCPSPPLLLVWMNDFSLTSCRLPYSSIFCPFWLFFVFKLLLSFFWLCEEAQCVYLRLHLGQKSLLGFSMYSIVCK